MILKYSWPLILTTLLLASFDDLWARQPIPGTRFEHLSGIRKTSPRSQEEDGFVFHQGEGSQSRTSRFLMKNYEYIPQAAHVLEIGIGEGHNAVFLARKGYNVTGLDRNSTSISKAQDLAREFNVRINTVAESVHDYNAREGSLDGVMIFHYVNKNIQKKILSWLRPGGVLIFEAYTDKQRQVEGFEQYDSKFFLKSGELLTMFPDMKVLKYQEPLHLNDYKASIILKKPLEEDQQ